MAGYVIAEAEVLDQEPYQEYVRANTETVTRHGGRFIVRGGRCEVVEGNRPLHRLVVIEFPSFEDAKAWYESPAYQAVLPIRHKHARTIFVAITEGTP